VRAGLLATYIICQKACTHSRTDSS